MAAADLLCHNFLPAPFGSDSEESNCRRNLINSPPEIMAIRTEPQCTLVQQAIAAGIAIVARHQQGAAFVALDAAIDLSEAPVNRAAQQTVHHGVLNKPG